jgi:methionine aminopeptidase
VQGRTLAGEHFSLLIENSGPGGFYCEIGRTVVLGKASNELTDGFEAMREAQAATLALMKPGASCGAIADAHDAFMRKRGLPAELRLYCHGQGYDLVERPLVRADETMAIDKDMNFDVHPGYATTSIFAVICNHPHRRPGPRRMLAPDAQADLRAQLTLSKPQVLTLGTFPDATMAELERRFSVHHFTRIGHAVDGLDAATARQILALGREANQGINRAVLAMLPKLEVVALVGVGTDLVDRAALKERSIR